MTIELYTLLATALLLLILAILSGQLYGKQVGNLAIMGNRETIAAPTGAARRATRAHQNLLENAVPFAIVVLTAQALDISTRSTQIAALVFVFARLVHALAYVTGIPVVRTFAWLSGLVATLVIGFTVVTCYASA
jgi:uncharacterized MAPEG superfamily protein